MGMEITDRSGDRPSNVHCGSSANSIPASDEIMSLEEAVRCAILRALREANGNKVIAARLLRIGRTTLHRRLKQYQAAAARRGSLEYR